MKSFLSAAITIWQREIIRYVRDRIRIFSSILQPLMFLFIFGSGLSQTLARGNFGVDYVQFMFPGIVAMSIMGVAFFSTVSTVWDREFGFLKEILVTPVSRTSIAVGKTAGATTIAIIQALLLLIVSPLIGVTYHLYQVPVLIFCMLLLAFAMSGLGLLISSIIKTTEGFSFLMQIIVFPMFFTSGALFPLTSVPAWMLNIAKANPLTYGVDAMRHIILEPVEPEAALGHLMLFNLRTDVIFLLIFSVLMIISAVIAFKKKN